mgnify:CR=1 FL=1
MLPEDYSPPLLLHKPRRSIDDSVSLDPDDPSTVTYIPSLYLPSTWAPPPSFDKVELAFGNFDAKLNEMKRALPRNRRHNLSPSQRNVVSELRNHTDLVIFQTDKNLGPSITERTKYIRNVLQTHLTNEENYELLSHATARRELQKQRDKFLEIYSDMGHFLPSEAEEVYFKRAMTKTHLGQTRVPQIYGIYKVHKEDIKPRPVISSDNRIPEIFSKHVDYWLNNIVDTLAVRFEKLARRNQWGKQLQHGTWSTFSLLPTTTGWLRQTQRCSER